MTDPLAALLLDRSPLGILVTGPDGRITAANPALATMVPVVPNPIGRSPIEAIPIRALADALAPDRQDEDELAFTSGVRDLLISVFPAGPEGGRVAQVQDVSRIRRAEESRGELIANLSHELRTPATAIAGYAETLLEDRDSLDPMMVEALEAIQRNGRRLMDMFGDLLTLSRIDAAHNPLPLYRMALLPLVSEAVEKHKSLWRSKRIQVDVAVPEALEVVGNREALGHIIGNLVHNAIKYSFEDGVVTVRAAARDRWALVEVIDLGIGIDRAHHERIFDRFYRVDKGRARSVGGTGLGLAIVKKLVDAMGAAIEVRSKPGAGSIFRLLLTLGLEEHPTEPVEVDGP